MVWLLRGRISSSIRCLSSPVERIRATSEIKKGLDHLEKHHEDAAKHLREYIKRGATCRYLRAEDTPWHVDRSPGTAL